MRQPGIEPGSIAWKATMLTFTPPTLLITIYFAAESFNFLWNDDEILYNTTTRYFWKLKFSIINLFASAGNRTRIYCLEGNNANLYTTNAVNNNFILPQKGFNFLWNDDEIRYNTTTRYFWKLKFSIIKIYASAGNRTRIYCLKGNNANLYTTDAVDNYFILPQKVLIFSGTMMKFDIIPPLVTFENSNFLL